PGNVRELKNMVEQALLLAEDDELSLDEFPVLAKFRAGWQPKSSGARGTLRPPAVAGVSPSAFPGPMRAQGQALARAQTVASLGVIRERHLENERARLVEALTSSGGNVS